jgi:hypothetical protein
MKRSSLLGAMVGYARGLSGRNQWWLNHLLNCLEFRLQAAGRLKAELRTRRGDSAIKKVKVSRILVKDSLASPLALSYNAVKFVTALDARSVSPKRKVWIGSAPALSFLIRRRES